VQNIAKKYDLPTLINTDTHAPSDLMDINFAKKVGLGCGMGLNRTMKSLSDYPKELIKKL
jgi:histidinol phosphatase-like PHP family hydrolase